VALIGQESRCAICDELLDRPFLATSGVAFGRRHHLYPYCDAPLHIDCLAAWPHRLEFSRGYFVNALVDAWRRQGTVLIATPRWYLCHSRGEPNELPLWVGVRLSEWPIYLSTGWHEWTQYVDGGFREGHLADAALEAAEEIMAEVRTRAPTLAALKALYRSQPPRPAEQRSYVDFGKFFATFSPDEAARIDWQLLDEAERFEARRHEEAERARALAIAQSNAASRGLANELATAGTLACPRCGRRSYDFRFIDKGAEAKSYFICGLCGCSFAGTDAREHR